MASENKKCIVFCGGGTAGHVYPNVALIERLLPLCRIVYIGSKNGMEKDIISSIPNVEYYGVTTVKLQRKVSLKNLLIPFKLIKGVFEARRVLKSVKPVLIFSKGGFVSLPTAIAAKCPVFCHESDYSMGLANKLIKRKCSKIFTSFPETARGLKNGVFTGSPVRPSIYNNGAATNGTILPKDAKEFAKIKAKARASGRKVLLIMGGSLGAAAINQSVSKHIDLLAKSFEIIHLTGKGKATEIVNAHYTQIEFCSDMGALYSITDVALSRGGGSALFELAALKIPALIIPLPKGISRGDQIDNALSFKKRGFCKVLLQENLHSINLCSALLDVLHDEKIKNSLKNGKNIDGTDAILAMLNEYIN